MHVRDSLLRLGLTGSLIRYCYSYHLACLPPPLAALRALVGSRRDGLGFPLRAFLGFGWQRLEFPVASPPSVSGSAPTVLSPPLASRKPSAAGHSWSPIVSDMRSGSLVCCGDDLWPIAVCGQETGRFRDVQAAKKPANSVRTGKYGTGPLLDGLVSTSKQGHWFDGIEAVELIKDGNRCFV